MTSKEIKSKITEEWKNAFPQLTLFSQFKFYKIISPLIIGLELIKLPGMEKYRPHFVVYALWENKIGNDLKASLSGPIMLKEYYNEKGLQFSIPYEKHQAFFNAVLTSIKIQTPLSFDGDISLREIFSALDEYSKTSSLSAAPNSYLQAALQESKFKIALYINVSEAKRVLDQIKAREWDIAHFKMCGIDINNWFESLQQKIYFREDFLNQINVNRQDKKLSHVKNSLLTA